MSIYKKFCNEYFDEYGRIKKLDLVYEENFNFGYDVVDVIATQTPDKTALVWCNTNNEEKVFSFSDIKNYSNKVANVFLNAGLKKGDRVMVILKRHYEYWFIAVALHKLGITLIPATHMLTVDDLVYRINASQCNAIICTPFNDMPDKILSAMEKVNQKNCRLWTVKESVDGFMNLNEQMARTIDTLPRVQTHISDPMLIYFTSGTTGYPKGVIHDFTYPLAHIVTAKYWHQAEEDGLHLSIAELGWAKASWGKIYGQWLVGSAIMVCDFDNFDPKYITTIINKYQVTSFCAPPTFFRYLVLKGIPAMPSLKFVTTAGEILAPDVIKKFQQQTGLTLCEGYGQTETTLLIGNLKGYTPSIGGLGVSSPFYKIELRGKDGKVVAPGEIGEVVVVPDNNKMLPGIVRGYLGNEEYYNYVWRGGVYHTGDAAWQDEDGKFWFHGRFDDIIKTGGFRVGPGEIENVLMEYPAVVECCVIGIPDVFRGQAIKAYIKLDKKHDPTKQMEREVKEFCNSQLAEYKWIRVIEFVAELKKTTSGKIRKNELKKHAQENL